MGDARRRLLGGTLIRAQPRPLILFPEHPVSLSPADLTRVTVNVFPGGFNWPSFVAQSEGFFARESLAVELLPTPNSIAQMTGLATGAFDIAMTAFDNIVAYVEGQGEAPIGPQPDFFAFMGSDSGFLSLVATPDVAEIGDLAHRVLSVDARTTGYAFVLLEMMRRAGFPEETLTIEKVGGMVQRYGALLEKRQAATLLSAPYNILARRHGLTQLAHAVDSIGPYQGNVAAARRGWAEANSGTVTAFIRAYAAAIAWLYVPDNRARAIAVLRANVEMDETLAQETYDELLDPARGFFKEASVDRTGMATVLALRSRYGVPAKHLDDPARYYDPQFYESALAMAEAESSAPAG